MTFSESRPGRAPSPVQELPARAPGSRSHGLPHRSSFCRRRARPSRAMPAVGRRMAPAPHLGRDKAPFAGAVRGRPWKADGVSDRATGPDAVRYASVDTATPRRTVTHSDTRRDKNENSPAAAFPQPGGRFRRWWQVLGSNQRRLSRRFYSLSLLAESNACDQRIRRPRGGNGPTPSAIREHRFPGAVQPRTGALTATDGGRGNGYADRPHSSSPLTWYFRMPVR